ncbi:hypothetical protein [Blastococcus sp. SYSU D00820]
MLDDARPTAVQRSAPGGRRGGPRHAADEEVAGPDGPGRPWPPAALAVVVLAGARALSGAARPGEGALAGEAGAGAAHVAAWQSLTGAGDRGLFLVAAVVSAALVWWLGARLRLPGPTCALAVLVVGLPTLLPATALLDRPAALAVPWLLAAGLLLTAGHRTALAAAAVPAAVAVLLAPDVLALAAGAAATAGATGRRTPPALRAAAAAGGTAALVVLAVVLPRWDGAGGGAADPLGTPAVLGVAAGLAALAAAAAVALPGLRPLAGAVLATALLAAVLDRSAALQVALPAAALLLAALATRAATRLAAGRPALPRALAAAGAAALLALAALAGTGVLRPTGDDDGPRTAAADRPADVAPVLDWLAGELPDDARVAAPADLRAELLAAGADPGMLPADLPDAPAGPGAPVLQLVETVPEGAVLVARFVPGNGGAPLLAVDPFPVEPTPEELDRRRGLAEALLANPTTRTGGRAAEVLAGAEVDQRLLSLLAGLAAREGVGIADLPPAPGEEGGAAPARRALLDTVGGRVVPGDRAATERLLAWLDAQRPPFAPDTVEVTDSGVLVGFDYVSGPDALVTGAAE